MATDLSPPLSSSRRPRLRRLMRFVGLAALVVALAAGGGYLWLASTATVRNVGEADCARVNPTSSTGGSATPPAGDCQEICAVLDSLVAAWNANDADAYGALFTEDATYVTFVGTFYQGRGDIVETHRALFGGFLEGTKLADSFLGIRFLGPDAVVVTSRGDTYTGAEPDERSKVQTFALVRQGDGKWRVAAFQNTQRLSVMERISFLLSPETTPRAEK